MKFLYAAYGITWAVHIIYLLILTRGFARLRDDIKDLEHD
jgi:hypothetical protein